VHKFKYLDLINLIMSSIETIISCVRIKPLVHEEESERICSVSGNTILF